MGVHNTAHRDAERKRTRGNTEKKVNSTAPTACVLRNGNHNGAPSQTGRSRQTAANRYCRTTLNTPMVASSQPPRRATTSPGRLKTTTSASTSVTACTARTPSRVRLSGDSAARHPTRPRVSATSWRRPPRSTVRRTGRSNSTLAIKAIQS